MLYKTTCAISHLGERIEKGAEIELDEKVAANYGEDLVAVSAVAEKEVEEVEPEKSLEEMSHSELKAKAEELGLKKSGTMADLIDRITLKIEGGEDEEETTDEDEGGEELSEE